MPESQAVSEHGSCGRYPCAAEEDAAGRRQKRRRRGEEDGGHEAQAARTVPGGRGREVATHDTEDRATRAAARDEEGPNAAQRAPGTLRGGEMLFQVKLAWDEGLVLRVLLHLTILTMKLESCNCKCCVSYAFSGRDRRQGIDM